MSNVAEAPSSHQALPGFMNRLARTGVSGRLANLRRGEITMIDANGSQSLGQPGDLHATLRVHHPRFYRDAMLGGTLSVAESYLRGDWDCDDLTSLFRIFVRNRDFTDRLDRGLARLAYHGQRLYHWLHSNTRTRSRRNISAHYDLGNEFFQLWLDDSMAYSCGVFVNPGATLREASLEKFDRICRKLDLRPSDKVLEIGSGWGGFAIHAAQYFGCHVTTTTISREQFDFAQERINRSGLADRITLLPQDYRDLSGQFDKLVSIEMIEAVGHKYLDQYFGQCGKLLRPGGSMALQAIVMPDRDYEQYRKSVDFIQRYVFPGGCLPSLEAILGSLRRSTDLRLVHAEDFSPHYAETLRRWRRTFQQRLDEVRGLGCTDEFIRLWNYYLCYCEAAFEERATGVMQFQFDKPECRRDPVNVSSAAAASRDCIQSNPFLESMSERTSCEN